MALVWLVDSFFATKFEPLARVTLHLTVPPPKKIEARSFVGAARVAVVAVRIHALRIAGYTHTAHEGLTKIAKRTAGSLPARG